MMAANARSVAVAQRRMRLSTERIDVDALYPRLAWSALGALAIDASGAGDNVPESRRSPTTLFMKNRTQHIDPCGKITNGCQGPCYDPPTLFCPEWP
jgi:hypothetical protein